MRRKQQVCCPNKLINFYCISPLTIYNMGFGYTRGRLNLCFGLLYMAGQQSGDPTPLPRNV